MKATITTILLVAFTTAARADQSNDDFNVSVTPIVRYVDVSGNAAKFREDWRIKQGWAGGVNEASLIEKLNADWTLYATGHAIFDEDDYKLRLEIVNPKVGFVRAGYTEFTSYFDNVGGYYKPFTTRSFDLHRNLELQNGDLFFETGLTLPDIPKITLGYERQFRDGTKSLLEWGSVTEGATTRKIFPSFKEIDETVDIAKLQVEHDVGIVHLANAFRYEHYNDDTKRYDTSTNLVNGANKTVTIKEEYHHDSFFNTFRMDSHVNDKVYWSLGYMYNNMSGDGGLNVTTPPPLGPFDKNWVARTINVDVESNVLNVNAMFGPFAGFVAYAGLQGEITDTHGFTDALLTEGTSATTTNLIHSSDDKQSLEETLGLRYTKIKYTTLYAEGKWTEQQYDLNERETQDGTTDLQRATDTSVMRQDYAIGFNSAPLARLLLAGRYRRSMYDNDYDNQVDPVAGYPAFITAQHFTTDEVMGKLTLRPTQKFTVTFKYQYVSTVIDTSTDSVALLAPGGSHQSGDYDANIYTVNATLTPVVRLYLTGLFSYVDTRTSTYDNRNTAVSTYHGDVYSVLTAAGYALDAKTDVTTEFTYSRSDNTQNNAADGLPLGVNYERFAVLAGLTRHITQNIIARLRYGYFYYNDTSNSGSSDYRANMVSTSWTLRF